MFSSPSKMALKYLFLAAILCSHQAHSMWPWDWCGARWAQFMGQRDPHPALAILSDDPFTADDFPKSDLWKGQDTYGTRPHSEEYSKWAAAVANNVTVALLNPKVVPREALGRVAAARTALEIELETQAGRYNHYADPERNPHDARWFGLERKWPAEYHLTNGKRDVLTPVENRAVERAKRELNPITPTQLQALKTYIVEPYPTAFAGYVLGSIQYRENYYVTRSGKKILASRILLFTEGERAGHMKIIHPSAESAELILSDAMARLQALRKRKLDTAEKREAALKEFLTIMYGYHSASRFHHGGGSIGRSFFAGAYLAIFGKKPPPFPDGMDLFALTAHSSDEFVTEFLPAIK